MNAPDTLHDPLTQAGRRVLVTGGTGFIGSHLVEALAVRGVQPRVLVRRTSDLTRLKGLGIEWIEGELEDPASLARAVEDVDGVFHLAAATRARSESVYTQVNTEGTHALLEAILAATPPPRRLVYLSSLAAAGPASAGRPVAVQDSPHPLTAYGRSKLAGERICLAAAGDLEVVALRAPVVYGPRDRDFFLFFQLAAQGILPVPTGSDRLVQLLHVHDLVEALIRAAAMPDVGGVYHVAESRSYAWSEMTTWIARALGTRVRAVRVPPWLVRGAAALSEFGAASVGRTTIFNRDKARELLAPGWLCETAAAKQDLHFEARIPLPEGLTETVGWYRKQGWL